MRNGNTTFVDSNNSFDTFRGKTLDHEPRKEWKSALSRRKRDLLFPSGVKLCSHETVQQAVQNHLNYFHLRGKNMIVWLLLVFEQFWRSLQKEVIYGTDGCSLRTVCESFKRNELIQFNFSSIIMNQANLTSSINFAVTAHI